MADDANKPTRIPIPPKLDLSKHAAPKPEPAPAAPTPPAAEIPSTGAPLTLEVSKGSKSSQTIHIRMPEQPRPEASAPAKPEAAAAPVAKPAAAVPAPAAAAAPKSETAPLGKPVGMGQPAAKHATSKIALVEAKPTLAIEKPPGAPKTIRIKPRPVPAPDAVDADTSAEDAARAHEARQAAKRKTSRVSLEAALEGPQEPGAGTPTPKTIRLKRPSEAPTVKVRPAPATTPAGAVEAPAKEADAPAPDQKKRLGETARLDQLPVDTGATPTQRKTIKVKRPTQMATGMAKPVLRRAGGAPASADGPTLAGPPRDAPSVDKCNPVFPIFTIAALLVVCVTVYLFCAQVFGPNPSLTRLSYGVPELDLPWPGKMSGK